MESLSKDRVAAPQVSKGGAGQRPAAPRSRRGGHGSPILFGLTAVLALEAGLIATGSSYSLFILISVLLAIIGASALNLLQGTVGQVSIGNAAFLAVGAFTSVAAQRAGVSAPWDIVVAVVAGAVGGAVVGLPALRIRGFYLAFATLAAHFIVVQLAQTYQTDAVGEAGFIVPPDFPELSVEAQMRSWAVVLTVVVTLVLLLVRVLTTSRLGRAWRIIRDKELVAPTMGIRVAHYKMGAFMVSSALIALQGALYAHVSGYVSIDSFTLALAISYVAMILIGGEDSLLGSVIGAVVVVSLPYVTSGSLDALGVSTQFSAQIAQLLYGALIVAFVVYSWGGLASSLKRLGSWVGRLTAARRDAGVP